MINIIIENFENIDKNLLLQKGKIIHQVWFGTIPNKSKAKKTYEKMRIYRNSWKEKNSTWYQIEWNKEMSNTLVKTFYPEHYELYKNYKYEIQRCDTVRYMILHRYGGLYADMDYFCNKPFDQVFEKYTKNFYLVQTPNMSGDYVSNSLMYSVPLHPFWKILLINMELSSKSPIYYSKHLIIMYESGPGILNRIYHRYKLQFKLNSWPYKYFQPYGITDSIMSLKNDKVYSIHISDKSWNSIDSEFIVLCILESKFLIFIFLVIIIGFIVYKLVG